ncbi:bifunctional 5,10-methylene-tetrahydrofolate dehydrogenase/5,10-methylene-tetrahydrofolate cyclohydrolase, partial [Cyclobacteriaceae bacterium]|nr:bifunctional 5,10-methylene-tetrahydrofolate dehydrogenase/5,10-methylene-tetrahydrofolate cyclohydrolase [Cyclobacteriaceae bacterium]
MGTLLDGKKIANEIQAEVAQRVLGLKEDNKRAPHLAIILIGENGASHTYVNGKVKACKAVGFEYTLLQFAATITEEKLFKHIKQLNQ